MSGLPGSGLISHLPGGEALSNLLGGLQPPGMAHGLQGPHIDPISVRQMGDGNGLLGAAGRQVSNLLDGTLPGSSSVPFAGNHDAAVTPASWNGAPGTQGPPPWAGVPHEGRGDSGRSDFDGTPGPGWSPDDGPRTWNNGDDAPRWGAAPVANNGALNVDDMVGGITRDAATLLGLTGRPVDVQGTLTQSGRFAFTEEQLPSGVVAGSLVRGDTGRVTPANRVAAGDEAIPVDRQVTTQRPDGVQQGARANTGADAEVIEWRGGNPVERQGDQQNQIDPRMGWMSRVDQGPLLKLSLTVIPPVLREGEMTQSATRTALFRAIVDGQQAFIDSQGRVVGWAVRQDLPPTYVANVIQTEELLQLPDGRQVIVDSQGRLRSLATGEVLHQVGAALAAQPGMGESDSDARALAERAEARFRELMWSTVLPSCIGLLLVVAAFLSAAAVRSMPVTVHGMFFVGAVGLAVFCFRTWKRWQRLPDGSVTKLPAITRRLRMMMALSCSAQGASAALLGIAVVLH